MCPDVRVDRSWAAIDVAEVRGGGDMAIRIDTLALLGSLAAAGLACGGAGGAARGPAQASTPPPDGAASFTLRGASYGVAPRSYASHGGGLVFCRRQPRSLWVRLAAERAADGANGPHLDMDFCSFAGSGTYRVPHDVTAGLDCADGSTWDLWWHDGPAVFVSRPSSSPCEATLSQSGQALEGSFACHGLTRSGASDGETLDVLGGLFRCTLS
jgi:hypothetical protein